jgi:mannose-6-phosphate isomerase-like protein (cupin superfamily)
MQAFDLAQILADQDQHDRCYQEFLRVPTMSLGAYVLPAGAVDTQQPHADDEVYYVVSGRGVIRVGGEDQPVESGSIVFVPAGEKHYFHDISETLTTLVFFAPAETDSSPPA